MKYYAAGTAIMFVIFFPGSKSMLLDPNDFFNQYFLSWSYLNADFNSHFIKQGASTAEAVSETVKELKKDF
jgi:hypothetical protein